MWKSGLSQIMNTPIPKRGSLLTSRISVASRDTDSEKVSNICIFILHLHTTLTKSWRQFMTVMDCQILSSCSRLFSVITPFVDLSKNSLPWRVRRTLLSANCTCTEMRKQEKDYWVLNTMLVVCTMFSITLGLLRIYTSQSAAIHHLQMFLTEMIMVLLVYRCSSYSSNCSH